MQLTEQHWVLQDLDDVICPVQEEPPWAASTAYRWTWTIAIPLPPSAIHRTRLRITFLCWWWKTYAAVTTAFCRYRWRSWLGLTSIAASLWTSIPRTPSSPSAVYRTALTVTWCWLSTRAGTSSTSAPWCSAVPSRSSLCSITARPSQEQEPHVLHPPQTQFSAKRTTLILKKDNRTIFFFFTGSRNVSKLLEVIATAKMF